MVGVKIWGNWNKLALKRFKRIYLEFQYCTAKPDVTCILYEEETRADMNYEVEIILQSAFSWVYLENLIGLDKHKSEYPHRQF